MENRKDGNETKQNAKFRDEFSPYRFLRKGGFAKLKWVARQPLDQVSINIVKKTDTDKSLTNIYGASKLMKMVIKSMTRNPAYYNTQNANTQLLLRAGYQLIYQVKGIQKLINKGSKILANGSVNDGYEFEGKEFEHGLTKLKYKKSIPLRLPFEDVEKYGKLADDLGFDYKDILEILMFLGALRDENHVRNDYKREIYKVLESFVTRISSESKGKVL